MNQSTSLMEPFFDDGFEEIRILDSKNLLIKSKRILDIFTLRRADNLKIPNRDDLGKFTYQFERQSMFVSLVTTGSYPFHYGEDFVFFIRKGNREKVVYSSQVWANGCLNFISYEQLITRWLDQDGSVSFRVLFLNDKVLIDPLAGPSISEHYKNLKQIVETTDLYDLKLITKDGQEIGASKTVLVLQSPVFRAMFENNWTELNNRVHIEDIEFEVLREFIRGIHCGEVDLRGDVIFSIKVMTAADKYDVNFIREQCEIFANESMSEDNVISILIAADEQLAHGLKESALEFIVQKVDGKLSELKGYGNISLHISNLIAQSLLTKVQKLRSKAKPDHIY